MIIIITDLIIFNIIIIVIYFFSTEIYNMIGTFFLMSVRICGWLSLFFILYVFVNEIIWGWVENVVLQ